MGLFDRTSQVTDASTTILTYDNTTTETTNIQDSGNTITSITDAFNTSFQSNIENNVSDAFKTTIAQPIAILAGGGAGTGESFSLDNFFEKGLEPAANATAPAGIKPGKLVFWGVLALVGFLVFKRFSRK